MPDETTTAAPTTEIPPVGSSQSTSEFQQTEVVAPAPVAPEPAPAEHVQPAVFSTSSFNARSLLAKAREMIQGHKTKKLEKIMVAINQHGKITNDQVEKLLHVSDATAARYLSALVKQNKIIQVGKTGHSVQYQKL